MRVLEYAHWLVPWLILMLGMYLLVKFGRGYLDKSIFTEHDQKRLVIFRVLMIAQAVTGLTFFAWSGLTVGFPAYRVWHGLIMFMAAVILRLSDLWKNADDSTRYLNNFYVLLASFIVMLVGIALVPSTTGR